jgi:PAS domain S-box-containing protein
LRRVIATAGDAFVAMDENGAVTEWNAQAAATFGYASNKAIGQPLHELIIPEAQRAAPRRGAGPVPGDRRGAAAGPAPGARSLRQGGETFPVEVSNWALAGGDGWDFNAWSVTSASAAASRRRWPRASSCCA